MANKRKYTESHWLVFAFQGIVGLLFGWYVMFTNVTNLSTLLTIVAATLLILGIISIFNLIHRKRLQHAWGLTLLDALIEVALAGVLFFAKDADYTFKISLVAGYTLFRGVLEILIGLKSLTDSTDRFMWTVCGICGVILAFVIFNAGAFHETTFIQFFGTYMMIYGITNLIYGVHNKNELTEQKAHRNKLARERRRKSGK